MTQRGGYKADLDTATGPKIELELRHDDPIIAQLQFDQYQSKVMRAVTQFLPSETESQTCKVNAPWGEEEVRAGDYIGSEIGDSTHQWRIEKGVFESTYEWVEAGVARKKALIDLIPLEQLTHDPDAMVKIYTVVPGEEENDGDKCCIERAGDVYLARGSKGELYRYPIAKADKELVKVEPTL